MKAFFKKVWQINKYTCLIMLVSFSIIWLSVIGIFLAFTELNSLELLVERIVTVLQIATIVLMIPSFHKYRNTVYQNEVNHKEYIKSIEKIEAHIQEEDPDFKMPRLDFNTKKEKFTMFTLYTFVLIFNSLLVLGKMF